MLEIALENKAEKEYNLHVHKQHLSYAARQTSYSKADLLQQGRPLTDISVSYSTYIFWHHHTSPLKPSTLTQH